MLDANENPVWPSASLESLRHPKAPIVYGIVQPGDYDASGIPFVQSRDIANYAGVEGLDRTSVKIAASYKRSMVKSGDILFSLRGLIGVSMIAPEELTGANISRGVARIRLDSGVDATFVSNALRSSAVQKRVSVVTTGSTFKEISIEELRKIAIPLPPLEEQRKIAEILWTWDEAIDAASRLIAAKRQRYTALRQRIFGRGGAFPEAWPRHRLTEISRRIRRANDGADHPVMTISAKSGFLMQGDKFARDMAGRSLEKYTLLREGEFAYNKGNSKTSPYGCIFALDRPTAVVPFVYFCFALNDGLDHQFYAHLFGAGALDHQLSRVINSGVRNDGLLNLNAADFFSCKVPVPPIEEQRRIAEVLTEAKAEISLLETRLKALQRQKRGLMQKLLTGEWRVSRSPSS